MPTPKQMLREVYWSFYQTFASRNEFTKALRKYHKDILQKTPNLTNIVFNEQEIVIQFLLNPTDQQENADYQEDRQLKITTQNPQGFKTSELLYKINNAVIENDKGFNLAEEDAHFFEGLQYLTDDDPAYPQTKVYFMILGS